MESLQKCQEMIDRWMKTKKKSHKPLEAIFTHWGKCSKAKVTSKANSYGIDEYWIDEYWITYDGHRSKERGILLRQFDQVKLDEINKYLAEVEEIKVKINELWESLPPIVLTDED